VLLGALLVVGVAVVWVAARWVGDGGASTGGAGAALPSSPPESWTHQELLDHINRKGKLYAMCPASRGGPDRGPASYLVDLTMENAELVGSSLAAMTYRYGDWGVIRVELRKTAADAREAAGAGGAFSWGRFLFDGPPEDLERVRAALR
jgi:hypothetical protein